MSGEGQDHNMGYGADVDAIGFSSDHKYVHAIHGKIQKRIDEAKAVRILGLKVSG